VRYLFAAIMTGCVIKDSPSPTYQHDYVEAEPYDCPHAPSEPDVRCTADPKKVQPAVQSSALK
jgi:hypothetical protein